jgi:hypothetical protein
MEPILVPGPPKEAFNKNRRVSDLIKAQITHFKHIEEKLPPDVRRSLPQHHIVSEDDAARYVASMTKLLLSRPQLTVIPSPKKEAKGKLVLPIRTDSGVAIAAAADTARTPKHPAAKKNSLPKPKRTR